MKNINKKTLITTLITLIVGILLGWLLFHQPHEIKTENLNDTSKIEPEISWTCAMHPWIRKHEAGKCPICGMTLIPLENTEAEYDPTAVRMSPTAMQLAHVQTLVVGENNIKKPIRLNGKVQTDERLLFTQSSHVPGRIEKLSVNFTGDFVSYGQVLAYIYSPDLVTAQEELFEAQKLKETQPALFQAGKEKLKNWKLTDKQIEQILTSNKLINQFPILANVSGYVTKKMVNLGSYIKQGDPIYEIADLSKVWVLFDVYESDMPWIKKGEQVVYTIQSLPEKSYKGIISYIDPIIDPKTRVAKARVEVSNTRFKLKPEMFVSGIIESTINPKLYSVVIPKTAIMWTGKRSVVYIIKNTAQGINFVMREVILGPALGTHYAIESGLQPGEEIAVNGTFSIDAAAQLAGKPSMMNPGEATPTTHHHTGSTEKPMTKKPIVAQNINTSRDIKKALQPLFTNYFEMKHALSNDDFKRAGEAGKAMKTTFEKINTNLFKGDAYTVWINSAKTLKSSIQHTEHLSSIDDLRANFIVISNAMITIAESFNPFSEPIYIQECPMADSNKGAHWLSKEKEILNPYLGKAMPTCGEISKIIP